MLKTIDEAENREGLASQRESTQLVESPRHLLHETLPDI